MIVVAVDANDARAIDRRVEHLGRLEVRGNEDTRVEALLRGLRGDGVGQIAGRRAADGGETKAARSGESCGDDAVFERQGREANRVIFEIEIFQAPPRGEFARGNQRCAANGVWPSEVFGKREKLGIAPHVEVAARKILSAGDFLQRVVIVGNFERGEAVFAERAGNVAPGLAAFATSELVKYRCGHGANPSVFSVFSIQCSVKTASGSAHGATKSLHRGDRSGLTSFVSLRMTIVQIVEFRLGQQGGEKRKTLRAK